MGEENASPPRRQIHKAGMDPIPCFEAESQALALIDASEHAKVLDPGTTTSPDVRALSWN